MIPNSGNRFSGQSCAINKSGTTFVLGHSVGEIVLLAALIAGAGALVGILAGLFGIGGGAIIVPVLYEVFRVLGVPEDLRMQLCIGTSLSIIVPTTVRSYLGHKKKGAVIHRVVRTWALPSVAGVAIGSVTAAYAPSYVFKGAFVIFAGFIAVRMLFGSDRWSLGTELPGRGLLSLVRLHHRPVRVAGRGQRRRLLQRDDDALRPVHAARGRHLGRHRRADHRRRCRRLRAGGLAIQGRAAAAVDRLRVAHRPRA